jgi:hypothetical protein
MTQEELILTLEQDLQEAMEMIDDYLNAGDKEQRKLVHTKAKIIFKKYYGYPYVNRNEE